MKKLNLLIFFIIMLFFTNCIKEDVKIDTDKITKWDRPLFLDAPVAKASFYATEMIGRLNDSIKKYVFIDNDGIVSIKYKDSIESVWNDIVKIRNVYFKNNILLKNAKNSKAEKIVIKKLLINQKPTQRFDEMTINTADFLLNLKFPDGVKGKVDIRFPELTKNNNPLVFSYNLPSSNVSENKDISGYNIKFKHNADKDSSFINMELIFNITELGSILSPNIETEISIKNIVPKVMFGYFGKERILDEKKSLVFGFFEDFKAIKIVEFKDITVTAKFDNYFGVPFNGKVKNAILTCRETSEELPLIFKQNSLDSNTVFISPATYSNNIEPKENTVILDKTTSNIVQALNFFPDKLAYNMVFETNPNDDKTITNFVTSDNKILGNIFIEIPLWIRTKTYTRTDTINKFELFKNMDDNVVKYLDSVALGFDFYNKFPFELEAQVYLATANGFVVDSLFDNLKPILKTAKVDDNGKTITIGETKIAVKLTQKQVEKYKNQQVEKLLLFTKSITANDGKEFVKIHKDSGIKCNIFLSVKSSKIN